MVYVFLLTLWTADAPPQVWVEDSGLTGMDCLDRMEAYEGTRVPSCEFDAEG